MLVRSPYCHNPAERVRLVDAESFQPLAHRRDQSVELWNLARIRTRLRELKLDWDAKPLPKIESLEPIEEVEVVGGP